MKAEIDIMPEWDDRASVWRLAVWEAGKDEPTWLPGVGHAGTKHRLWPVVAAAATAMRGATSDHVGMRWDPEKTTREDMRTIAKAAQDAVAKVRA